jgi:hypothetical protein
MVSFYILQPLQGKLEKQRLYIDGLHDRATIYVNGVYVDCMLRGKENDI